MPIIIFPQSSWANRSAELIHKTICAKLERQGFCSVVLTGGRSAERLYTAWNNVPSFYCLTDVQFFFGDERCVHPSDPESNYMLALRSLFVRGIPTGCAVHRIQAEDSDREAACFRYETCLPSEIDVTLLSVGEDGHIASLFPKSEALDESIRRVISVVGAKTPKERITVTPRVIKESSIVFVLASGAKKAAVYKRVETGTESADTLPACLVREGMWLLDNPT